MAIGRRDAETLIAPRTIDIALLFFAAACGRQHAVEAHAASVVSNPKLGPATTSSDRAVLAEVGPRTRALSVENREQGPDPKHTPEPPSDMVYVPATEFFMGVANENIATKPGHIETAGPFFIDRLEVTVQQYLTCQKAQLCDAELYDERGCNASSRPVRLTHPMNCVAFAQAQRYCKAYGKRLPTAAEWELAARGTDKRPYPWGDAPPKEQLCWQGRRHKASSTTCPVGSFPQAASPYGALDMAGNVAEWTTSVIPGAYPPPIYDTRGGSYAYDITGEPDWSDVRVDLFGGSNPTSPAPEVGFRCVANVPL